MPANLTITLVFTGLCALLQCLLSALVIARRARTGVDLMDGGDPLLRRRIRAHGNFTETVPMALLMMALLELSALADAWLWGIGACLLAGRLLHALSLLSGNRYGSRRGGMALTLAVLSTQAVLCIWAAQA